MNNRQQRILIIDDHPIFSDGLRLILQTSLDQVEITSVDSAVSVLVDNTMLNGFDLVLVDLNMPDLDGFTFLAAVRELSPAVNVAVISGSQNKAEIERSIGLGARGFIPKNSSSDELLAGIDALLNKEFYLPERWRDHINWLDSTHAHRPTAASSKQVLTTRQLQVLELIKEGHRNKQIAIMLGISVSAVKGHIEKLFKVLGVNNRTSCVLAADERGLI